MGPVAADAQTLLETYQWARDADPKYRAALFNAQASQTATDQAKAAMLPSVRFEVDKLETRQRIRSSENSIFGAGVSTFPTDSQTFSITQPVYRRDLLERLEQARATVRQAGLTELAAQQDLMLRTAAAYLAVLAGRDSLALAQAEREAMGRALELARERLKGGLGTITIQFDTTARFALTQAREIEAGNKLDDAQQALQEIIGRRLDAPRALKADFVLAQPDPPVLEDWLKTAEAQNLALQARRVAAEVARIEIERQRAAYHPSVSLLYQRNRRDAGSTLFGGGSSVVNGEVTLRLSVPIFDGLGTDAVTREATHRHQAALQDVEQERRAVDRQTRAAFAGMRSGVGLVDALAQAVLAQRNALAAKEEGFRAGVSTLLPVLDAQRDLYLALRDHAQARYEHLLNGLRLMAATGALSEGDLATLNNALQ